jgi:membrane-associated phospholipid phosphatase
MGCCATFALYPADPPWLGGQEGRIAPVARIVAPIGGHVPLVDFDTLWETGTRYANDVAAMPSLHAAYTLLISLFLVPRLRSRWRHLLWLYAPVMAFALVYTGEHYVADIVAGWIYCVVVYVAIEWAITRWERRREPAEEHLTGSEPELEPAGAS